MVRYQNKRFLAECSLRIIIVFLAEDAVPVELTRAAVRGAG